MSDNYVLKTYSKFCKLPFGQHLFSWYAARRAPYFKTIHPLVTHLSENHCECLLKKRKSVTNHIGTVHVIAICNGLELAMGFMAEASIPKHLRWIPKGMQVNYTAKAETDITCRVKISADMWQLGDMEVPIEAVDINGKVVVDGTITLWISNKDKKQ